MKNCGAAVHDEVATRAFMDDLHDLLRVSMLCFVGWQCLFIAFYYS